MVVRKKLAITVAICTGFVLIIGLGLFAVLRAFQHVPEEYRQALKVDPARQRQASDQMLQRAAALGSDIEKQGRWQALFTAEQINGWLAVDLIENHPRTLPSSVRDPRLAIEPDRLMLFCKFRQGNFDGVATLTVQPYLSEPNVLALRICKVRVGAVPWGLDRIVEGISQVARSEKIRLAWQQDDGDPVLQVPLAQFSNSHGKIVRIETLEMGDGEILVAGTTEQRDGQ